MVRVGTLGIVGLLGLLACGADRDRFEPSTEDVGGVEVAFVPPLPDPLDRDWKWEFEVVREVPTVGSDGQPIVYDPGYVVTLRRSDLFILDESGDRPLVILDPEAPDSFVAFGSRGRGPGELGSGLRLGELSDGTLTVFDRSNRQLHLFSGDGTWIRSHRVRLEVPGDGFQIPNRDSYAISVYRQIDGIWGWELLELDARGGEIAPLLPPQRPSEEIRPGPIQRGRQLWARSPHSFLTMFSTQATVRVYDHVGQIVRRIELPMTQRILSEGDITEQIRLHGNIARRLEVGPAALTNMLYVPGDSIFALFLSNLWRAAEDPSLPAGQIYWRLFTEGGRYLGVLEIPENFRYLNRGRGTTWARVFDDDLNPVIQELRVKPVR